MKGLTNAVIIQGSSGGGGDVVYALNKSGEDISAGDKVFLNYKTLAATATYTWAGYRAAYGLFYTLGEEMWGLYRQTNTSGSVLAKVVYQDGALSLQNMSTSRFGHDPAFMRFVDDKVLMHNSVSGQGIGSNYYTVYLNNSDNPGRSFCYLGNGLGLKANGNYALDLCDADLDTGVTSTVYSTISTQYNKDNAFMDGNILLIQDSQDSKSNYSFYDITDKSSPSLLKTTSFTGQYRLMYVTGLTPGNYVIGMMGGGGLTIENTGLTFFIYKIGTDYSLVEADDIPAELKACIGQAAYPYYDCRSKTFTIGTTTNVYAYTFNGSFTPLGVEVDVDVSDKGDTDTPFMYVITPEQTMSCLSYKNTNTYGQTSNRFDYNDVTTGWQITSVTNINDNCLTGFATGETDAEGKYEVNTVLPETLTYTLTVTPDPDTFTFTGEVQ